jgi:hypothetical protein
MENEITMYAYPLEREEAEAKTHECVECDTPYLPFKAGDSVWFVAAHCECRCNYD